ncbi:Mariner Mos1 transposase [Anthophora retusa]
MSTNDAGRPGRPVAVTTPENVKKIHDMVMNDRRVKVRDISQAVNISIDRVHNILHEHLQMKKLSARWVPRLLTNDQKRDRVKRCKDNLKLFQRNPHEFLRRFITVDETWIHHYQPETKEQSKQWVSVGESAPKKAKTVPSAGKVMATIFWDSSAHTSAIVAKKLLELGYQILPHPPYSPDLAPFDYYLFPNMKKRLAGKKFLSNEEVIAETNYYFADLDKSYYMEGIAKLEHRWTKCIELEGDYVEK